MIDVKDVRVGNWVIKITGRDLNAKSFFEYKPIALDEYYYTFAKVCFPIKLSPGVLDKCGFTRESGEWFKSLTSDKIADKGPFLKYKHENRCWYLNDIEIPAQPIYLHQLQNLFYLLTKQELEIQLGTFKNIDIVGPVNFFVKPLENAQAATRP